MLGKIWIVSEKVEQIAQLCSVGKSLGSNVEALVMGPKEWADEAIVRGADKVYYLGQVSGDRMVEDYFATILSLANEEKPQCILFFSNKRGRLLAARMGAACGVSVLTDAGQLCVEDGGLVNTKMVYGGLAFRKEKLASGMKIACVAQGAFEPVENSQQGNIVEVGFVEPNNKAKCLKVNPKVTENVNLGSAKRVVGIGRGLAQQRDVAMIQELASALKAEVGCTRPIAEGEKWMTSERYIGISGAMLKPDLYLAVGISGQIQHMSGVNQAKTIIAINKDKQSPIFKQADYGIVGDLYTVVPALVDKLNGR